MKDRKETVATASHAPKGVERRVGVDNCGDTSKMQQSIKPLDKSLLRSGPEAQFLSWVKATGRSTSPSANIRASLKQPHRTPRRLTSQVFVNQIVCQRRGSAESNHKSTQVKLSTSEHSRQLHVIRAAAVSSPFSSIVFSVAFASAIMIPRYLGVFRREEQSLLPSVWVSLTSPTSQRLCLSINLNLDKWSASKGIHDRLSLNLCSAARLLKCRFHARRRANGSTRKVKQIRGGRLDPTLPVPNCQSTTILQREELPNCRYSTTKPSTEGRTTFGTSSRVNHTTQKQVAQKQVQGAAACVPQSLIEAAMSEIRVRTS
jgi:hypothetical protein